MARTVKCAFKHCKHESRELSRDEAVLGTGKRYYHEDCLRIARTAQKIKDTYLEYDSDVNIPRLVATINNILFAKTVEPDFLLFAVRVGIKNKYLHSPYGMHYLIDNHKIKQAYQEYKTKIMADKERAKITEVKENPVQEKNGFNHSPSKFKGFNSIFQ